MITDNSYYKGEIYIPQARPSITDEATDQFSDFNIILNRYEEECLANCLGVNLYEEFIAELDNSQSNGLKAGADTKWNYLLNGHTYTKTGEDVPSIWKGIRFKTPSSYHAYNTSFLADYVYFFYEQKQYIVITSSGSGIQKSDNLEQVAPRQKVVAAWNRFVTLVQGKESIPEIVYNNLGLPGVDYYKGNEYKSLYAFIEDMNAENGDTYYANFNPKQWSFINQFGL